MRLNLIQAEEKKEKTQLCCPKYHAFEKSILCVMGLMCIVFIFPIVLMIFVYHERKVFGDRFLHKALLWTQLNWEEFSLFFKSI